MAKAVYRPERVGIVVVDVLDPRDKRVHFGPAALRGHQETVPKICRILRETRDVAPIALLTFNGMRIDRQILEAAGQGASAFEKIRPDGFSARKVKAFFRDEEVGTVLVCGFNRVCCVYHTAQGALDAGLGAITSEKLMYSHNASRKNDDPDVTQFYRHQTEYFLTVGGVVQRIREANSFDSSPKPLLGKHFAVAENFLSP
jgi:hypothetical protein